MLSSGNAMHLRCRPWWLRSGNHYRWCKLVPVGMVGVREQE